jgi:hypothetical protein
MEGPILTLELCLADLLRVADVLEAGAEDERSLCRLCVTGEGVLFTTGDLEGGLIANVFVPLVNTGPPMPENPPGGSQMVA